MSNSLLKTVETILCPPDQQDEFTAWMLSKEGGFRGAKRLPDGTYAGVMKLAFTTAIAMQVKGLLYGDRYCFDEYGDCLMAFSKLKSHLDEPVGWIASRPKPLEKDYSPISTAPLDGTVIRALNFQFGHCNWCRSAAYQSQVGWVEVDSYRAGEPIDPTHWKLFE